jgi:hypothetical protein
MEGRWALMIQQRTLYVHLMNAANHPGWLPSSCHRPVVDIDIRDLNRFQALNV